MTTGPRKRTAHRLTGLLVLLAFAHPSAWALVGLGCPHPNGPQLETDWLLTVGWQKAFEPIGHH